MKEQSRKESEGQTHILCPAKLPPLLAFHFCAQRPRPDQTGEASHTEDKAGAGLEGCGSPQSDAEMNFLWLGLLLQHPEAASTSVRWEVGRNPHNFQFFKIQFLFTLH